jgi:hypothetical protein
MTIDLDIDLSFLVDTEQVDANDVLVALNDLETALEDYLNGIQAKERTLYIAPTILTISGGVITTTLDVHTVAAESGTADDLDTITAANNKRVRLKADTGDTITIKHGTGNITTLSGQDVAISGSEIVELFCLGSQWCVIGDGGGAVTLPDLIRIQMFS